MKKGDKLEKYTCYLEELARIHSRSNVFEDFLVLVVCCLSMQQKEAVYLSVIKKYSCEEAQLFIKAFASLVDEMDNNGQGFNDAFGDYFEEFLSNGKNGQFFTPQCLCDLMAKITDKKSEIKDKNLKVYDPTCGSGRLLLSSAKIDRNKYFIGADISLTCCYMTLINMCLNSMRGEVLYMDSLNDKVWRKWFVIVDYASKVPFIYEIEKCAMVTTAPQEIEVDEPLIIEEIPIPIIPQIGYVKFGCNC